MHIVIIGNGVSGITAARHIRKLSDHKITVISSETAHFYSRPALMYIYMGHMRYRDTKPYEDWFWMKNRIDLLQDHVESVDFSKKTLALRRGDHIDYDVLILAVGSKSNKFGWPGQDLQGVRGLYSMQDVEEMEKFSPGLNRAVVVGGGLIGIEMAEMFHSRKIPVTMLVRESAYWNNVLPAEESEMVSRHVYEHHIDLRLSSELGEIHNNGHGAVGGITTKDGERIDCGFVGLTPGVSPNVDFLKGGMLDINRGILVDDHLQTNIKDVYALGDCAELRNPKDGRRPIEAVWYTGKMMGETVAKTICGTPTTYDPGIWYNSAKFLDIEYQVYGTVPNTLPEHLDSVYWEHHSGKKSIRLVYEKSDQTIIGFNLMGIRYRHEVCEKWLAEKAKLSEIIPKLSLANFDPEFFKSYEKSFINACEQKLGTTFQIRSKRNWNAVFNFLNPTSA